MDLIHGPIEMVLEYLQYLDSKNLALIPFRGMLWLLLLSMPGLPGK